VSEGGTIGGPNRPGMRLAMRIVQWLEHPAADFVVAARW
jgi:hypothetical protein